MAKKLGVYVILFLVYFTYSVDVVKGKVEIIDGNVLLNGHKVDPENMEFIPREEISTVINELPDNYLKKLTADQLAYKDNLNKIKDLIKLDLKILKEALKKRYGVDIDVNNLLPDSHIEGDTLISGDNTINLKEFKGTHSIDAKDGKLLVDGNEYIGAQNVRSDGQSVSIDAIKSLNTAFGQVLNGKNVKVFSDRVEGDYASTFIQNGAVASDVYNFNSKIIKFSVEQADSLLSSGITVNSIENSEIEIDQQSIFMKTKAGTTLQITGRNFIEVNFEAFGDDSEIKIYKDKSEYEIKNGRLNYSTDKYTDVIETNSTAKIEIDEFGFGFRCLTINPVSTYWYFDNDIRKNFGINIPKDSQKYKLCIRRIKEVNYKDYDGLIDFVEKNIIINKIVNYLRHPLKNNQIASLLSGFFYKGLKDVSTTLYYDNNLIFLNNIFIRNYMDIKDDTLSVTYPSNYYTIKEMELDNGIHSIIQLDLDLKKQDLTQNLNYGYSTDYFEPIATIKDNVLIQDNGRNRLTILPVEHQKIGSFLK